jgi:FKBP-type peptidyl-prolyl cis-trans isomerase
MYTHRTYIRRILVAKPHQRVFALIIAMLFLATAVAGGVVVLWQIKEDNDKQKPAQTVKLPEENYIVCNNQENKPIENKEGPLQGTKLTDFTPVDTIPELVCIDLKEGTGEVVRRGARVTAHYTGAVAKDGVIFQSSHDSGSPVPFSLDGVIKGWTEGVPGMKVGGIRRLLIPAALAYGESPPPNSGIPANGDLVFDIELVATEN